MIRVGDFRIGKKEKDAVMEVLNSGRITEGVKTALFEQKFAEFVGTKHCIAVNSGTSALIAGLSALIRRGDIKAGSKVITTPITYIATSNSIVVNNLEPVFVDISMDDFCITPENIKMYLEGVDSIDDYSLILPVHLMGFP